MLTLERINLLIFLSISFFIFFLVIFNSPYYLELAATDSGYDYTSDSLSLYLGEGQSHYNHPGLIPMWIGSVVIRFFISENFNSQNFINTMSLISYLFLFFSFFLIIKFYKDKSYKTFFLYPLCLTCFLWPPFIGSLTSFSSYSFLPSFTILFLIFFLKIFLNREYLLSNFIILSILSIILLTTHIVTIFLVFVSYLVIFLKLIKINNKNYINFFLTSLFLLILLFFLIAFIEPKTLLPSARLFIKFSTNFFYSFLGYSDNSSIIPKLFYFATSFKLFFLILFSVVLITLYLTFSLKKERLREKFLNNEKFLPILFLFLFLFYITFCSSDFFVEFDKNFYTFKVIPDFYPKDFNYAFNGSKLNSFSGIFLIFIFIFLYEIKKKYFQSLFKKEKKIKIFLAFIYIAIIFSIFNTDKILQKNYNALNYFYNDEYIEFINNTIPNQNFIAHDFPSKSFWFGPNTTNFSRGSSKKIKTFFERDYHELQLTPLELPKLKELGKLSQESLFNRYYEIFCNKRYDLLRKPSDVYKNLGVIFDKFLTSKTCYKILYFLINHDSYTLIQTIEFISGERFGIKPGYILIKKRDFDFNFYDLEKRDFFIVKFTFQEFLNEINNNYVVEEYKTVKFKNSDYIVIKLK